MQSVIRPKRTTRSGWECISRANTAITLGYAGFVWVFKERNLMVISALEVIEDEPVYHMSISRNGKRCSRQEAKFVLRCFGMSDAEEDNHVPGGFVRNFFLPVNEKQIGRECPCKAEETAIIEDKGEFVWRGIQSR